MVAAIWSDQVDPILSIGQSLEGLGIRNWALDRKGALNALGLLLDVGVAVSGGDVYRRVNGVLVFTYDDWYCNKEVDESVNCYVERSIDVARDYIAAYPEEDVFFALVPGF